MAEGPTGTAAWQRVASSRIAAAIAARCVSPAPTICLNRECSGGGGVAGTLTSGVPPITPAVAATPLDSLRRRKTYRASANPGHLGMGTISTSSKSASTIAWKRAPAVWPCVAVRQESVATKPVRRGELLDCHEIAILSAAITRDHFQLERRPAEEQRRCWACMSHCGSSTLNLDHAKCIRGSIGVRCIHAKAELAQQRCPQPVTSPDFDDDPTSCVVRDPTQRGSIGQSKGKGLRYRRNSVLVALE